MKKGEGGGGEDYIKLPVDVAFFIWELGCACKRGGFWWNKRQAARGGHCDQKIEHEKLIFNELVCNFLDGETGVWESNNLIGRGWKNKNCHHDERSIGPAWKNNMVFTKILLRRYSMDQEGVLKKLSGTTREKENFGRAMKIEKRKWIAAFLLFCLLLDFLLTVVTHLQ